MLREGDIVSIDCGVVMDGYYGDSAITVPVGSEVTPKTKRLLDVTKASLETAIGVVRPGATLGDIGAAVQEVVEADGFSVVRDFVGHGIGTGCTKIRRFRTTGSGDREPSCAQGMVLAIEPMVNVGKPGVQVLSDGWTAVTEDGSLSAHFEHTVAVTAEGAVILT